MYLKENAIEFEKSIFNNRNRIEQVKYINNYFKENNINYIVNIIEYDATGKFKSVSVEEQNKTQHILDENYTYIIKNTINNSNPDVPNTELCLYTSIYKNKSECKLFVYKTNRILYYNYSKFPKKYINIVDSMLEAIDIFKI